MFTMFLLSRQTPFSNPPPHNVDAALDDRLYLGVALVDEELRAVDTTFDSEDERLGRVVGN